MRFVCLLCSIVVAKVNDYNGKYLFDTFSHNNETPLLIELLFKTIHK